MTVVYNSDLGPVMIAETSHKTLPSSQEERQEEESEDSQE